MIRIITTSILLSIIFACNSNQTEIIEPVDPKTKNIHTLRFRIETTGNALLVKGRISVRDSIYFDQPVQVLDTTYVITLSKGDVCNLDISGQKSTPQDSVTMDYNVNAKAYIDDKLIHDVTSKLGMGIDIYYDQHVKYY